MSEAQVLEIGQQALQLSLLVAAPLLALSLVIGIAVSLFQVATSIQDVTLTFVPKILGVTVALLLVGPWMVRMLVDFTQRVFIAIPAIVG